MHFGANKWGVVFNGLHLLDVFQTLFDNLFTFFVNSTLSIFKSLYYNFLSTILAMLPANANELDRHVLTVVLDLFLFTYIDFGDDRAS